MPHLPPMYQVSGIEHGHTGKVLKGRGDKIVILTLAANGRVWIKARKNRVADDLAHMLPPFSMSQDNIFYKPACKSSAQASIQAAVPCWLSTICRSLK